MRKYNRQSQSRPVGRQSLSKLSHKNQKEEPTSAKQSGVLAKQSGVLEKNFNSLEKLLLEPSPVIGERQSGEHRTVVEMAPLPSSHDIITALARAGAKQILAAALEQEIQEYIDAHAKHRDEHGHQQIVRNGRCEARNILTGIGNIEVEQPRVRDKREKSEREKFTSKILPPYLRKVKTLDEFIPILYLRGVSTGDMEPTLRALLGENTKGLSAQTVSRLKMQWKNEFDAWSKRSLADKKYVYVWADGVYFSPRGDESKVCMLVLIGVLEDGTKEVITISDGFRESEQSWSEVLLSLKNRGLEHAPLLAIGDGALGFWNALRKIFPTTQEQRCWFHKKGNVLTKLPDSLQGKTVKIERKKRCLR